MTTGKTIALTRRTFVGKVTSLLFNMLSRLVIDFLSRSKGLLISWLQSLSAVILEPPKIKSATVFTVSPSSSHEVVGPEVLLTIMTRDEPRIQDSGVRKFFLCVLFLRGEKSEPKMSLRKGEFYS